MSSRSSLVRKIHQHKNTRTAHTHTHVHQLMYVCKTLFSFPTVLVFLRDCIVIFTQWFTYCYLDASNQVETTTYKNSICKRMNVHSDDHHHHYLTHSYGRTHTWIYTAQLCSITFASCKFFIFYGGPMLVFLVGDLHNHFSRNSTF